MTAAEQRWVRAMNAYRAHKADFTAALGRLQRLQSSRGPVPAEKLAKAKKAVLIAQGSMRRALDPKLVKQPTKKNPRRPAKRAKRRRSPLDQAIDARINELLDSYIGFGRTGRAKYDDHGEVIGRHKGYGSWGKSIRPLAEPARLVAAMQARKGTLYQKIRFWLGEDLLVERPELRQRRGTLVAPHEALKRGCRQCGEIHSGTAHRSHGPASMVRRGEAVERLEKRGGAIVRPPEEVPAWVRENPRGRVIYGRVLEVVAQRTNDHICDAACKRVNHVYRHRYTGPVVARALPDGTIRLASE